jgi:RimJ/RimL family protein N-acetyltransferase
VEHADEMVSVLSDPGLYEHIGGDAPSAAELRARYARQVQRVDWLNWMLRLKDGERLIGFIQATRRGNEAELAWLVAPAEQGAGLATEAAMAVAEWLPTAGVTELTAYIHPANSASAIVAGRLGLVATDETKDGETRWVGQPAVAT